MLLPEERKQLIEKAVAPLKNVSVDIFEGLLADYVNSHGFNVVIRGLRTTSDFDSEIQMAQMNASLFNANKAQLQKDLYLPQREDVPLFVIMYIYIFYTSRRTFKNPFLASCNDSCGS